jgi:parallel beta-helix repeat protein
MTNEPTRAELRCGLARGGPYTFVEEDAVMATSHTIELQPLSINTDYYFVIDLVDVVGNETMADNNGLCYSFATSAEFPGFLVPSVYPTIQAAIDDASEGDTIWVADGMYTGEGNFDIDFKRKAITVRSENGPENCIIDFQRERRGFNFHSGEDENSVLDGFTITKGFAGESGGGGIRCTASSPTISNCIIVSNSARDYGGGICNSYSSHPTLINCTFSQNSAESTVPMLGNGGGMCNLVNSSPTLINCTFTGNSASYSGAGMYNYENSSPTLTKCTFSANSTKHGGGMYNCYDSSPTLTNCTFSKNSAEYGGAMKNYESAPTLTNCTLSGNSAQMGGGIWNGRGSASKLTNCILWGNSDTGGMGESAQISDSHSIETSVANYCCVQGGAESLEGIANIDSDPLFVDSNAADYHLKSTGWRWDRERQRWHYDKVTSPCIDAGNPGSPLGEELLSVPGDSGNKWGVNLRINMGTYGGTAEASMPPYGWTLLADLTNDGIVNARDFAAQARYWMRAENPPKAGMIEANVAGQQGDLNRDGVVDTTDVALLAEDWLKHVKPPVVNIISPQDGATFLMQPVEIEIEAQAWDINGSVVKVEFFVSGRKLSEDCDGSDGWKAQWREYARGAYKLTARATDNSGVTTTSPAVGIRIIPPR